MNRIKIIVLLLIVFSFSNITAQEIDVSSKDAILKQRIYEKNKKKVLNYSMKQFDALFFDFSSKKASATQLLTKEEFYNYTIQIAIFSDRLASLYQEEKEIAEKNKKKWFAESYEDYLLSKESQKK